MDIKQKAENFFEKLFAVGGILGVLAVVVIIVAIVLAIVPFVLMLAWNTVIPYVFNLPKIDFIQALALWVVAFILFGNTSSKK